MLGYFVMTLVRAPITKRRGTRIYIHEGIIIRGRAPGSCGFYRLRGRALASSAAKSAVTGLPRRASRGAGGEATCSPNSRFPRSREARSSFIFNLRSRAGAARLPRGRRIRAFANDLFSPITRARHDARATFG